jgi:hypothetical protein
MPHCTCYPIYTCYWDNNMNHIQYIIDMIVRFWITIFFFSLIVYAVMSP